MVLLFSLYWFVGETPRYGYPLETLGIIAVTLMLVLGISLTVGVYSTLSDTFGRVMGFLSRPLIMISLVIHTGERLPEWIRYWVSWNPLADINEMLRYYMLGLPPMAEATVEYPVFLSILLLAFGMISYQANRFRLMRQD